MFEGWEYKDDELVQVETLEQQEEEEKIQRDLEPYLNNLGIPVRRIPEVLTKRTSDYEGMGVDFEVSAVQMYFPASLVKRLEYHAPTLIPEDTITRIIGFILLSGYSINFFTSSRDGGLSFEARLPFGMPLEINFQFTDKILFISQKSLMALK